MRRSRSPASSYCSASGRDNSDWDVWAFKVKLRLRSGTPYLALEVSAAQKGSAFARDGYLHQSRLPHLRQDPTGRPRCDRRQQAAGGSIGDDPRSTAALRTRTSQPKSAPPARSARRASLQSRLSGATSRAGRRPLGRATGAASSVRASRAGRALRDAGAPRPPAARPQPTVTFLNCTITDISIWRGHGSAPAGSRIRREREGGREGLPELPDRTQTRTYPARLRIEPYLAPLSGHHPAWRTGFRGGSGCTCGFGSSLVKIALIGTDPRRWCVPPDRYDPSASLQPKCASNARQRATNGGVFHRRATQPSRSTEPPGSILREARRGAGMYIARNP